MIGPETPTQIRAKLRKAFALSDGELTAWFDGQVKTTSTSNPKEIETLLLFRDALLKEVKRAKPLKQKARRAATAIT